MATREPDRIVRLKTVLARTGLSRSTIYRKIAEGTFPAQLKISTNGTGWHESEMVQAQERRYLTNAAIPRMTNARSKSQITPIPAIIPIDRSVLTGREGSAAAASGGSAMASPSAPRCDEL